MALIAMKNDPIVDEVRNNGLALAARYSNDIGEICKALKDKEQSSGRKVVNRVLGHLPPKVQTECVGERSVSIA